uniref:Tyrosine specific protein phosphatases domain-containing protein n=1 Tax=Ditylum brightwellii TaxID=49249 RepID=A0A7S4RLX0_9STRA|mmetsp:Transcript_10586/g.14283  ORF Transcript_10586/g.14283 Transcript_10586/m.14283 type:complete len:136 (-) Transcript_10586:354-761(-)
MSHLWLRTVDHFEPSLGDIKKAVAFIEKNKSQGNKVYVHCRAGHGRSAAIVFAWLLYKDPYVNAKELNEQLCNVRNVRKKLWNQPNIKEFHKWLKNDEDRHGGIFIVNDTDGSDDTEEEDWDFDLSSGDISSDLD